MRLILRRWAAVRLRTLLALILLVGLGFGLVVRRNDNIRQAREAIDEYGGFLADQRQFVWLGGLGHPRRPMPGNPNRPTWLRRVLGDELFLRPTGILLDASLSDRDKPDQQIDRVLELVGRLDGIEWADLRAVAMTDARVEALLGWSNLERLTIAEAAGVSPAGLARLSALRHLRILTLGQGRVTDAALADLSQLSGLTSFQAVGTHVTDAGLSHLGRLTGLAWLRLEGPGGPGLITDAGLAHLARLPRLAFLGLTSPGITDAGLMHFHRAGALKDLHLTNTAASEAGARALQRANPKLRISFNEDEAARTNFWVVDVADEPATVRALLAEELPGIAWNSAVQDAEGEYRGILANISIDLAGTPRFRGFAVAIQGSTGTIPALVALIRRHGWTIKHPTPAELNAEP